MVQYFRWMKSFIQKTFNSVAQLVHRVRFTRHNMAGNYPTNEDATRKTSITISGEYRKEEIIRNGNSSRIGVSADSGDEEA